MSKFEFSKSEKNLIFILTLVFAIFLYVTFFRGEKNIDTKDYSAEEKEFQYELLEDEYENLKVENEKLQEYEKFAKTKFENFGELQSLSLKLQEEGIQIANYLINKPANIDYNEEEISILNSQLSIYGEFSDLEKILEKILQISFVDVKNLNVSRIDKNRFSFNISLEETSLIPIPYNGIEITGENSQNISDKSLMQHLYSDAEEVQSEEPLENKVLEEKIKVETKEKNETPTKPKEEIKIKPITTESYYSSIDSKKDELIDNSYLKDYRDMDIEMVFDKNFFEANEEKFKKDKSIEKAVEYDEKTGAVTVDVPNKLKFKEVELKIENPNDFYVFEYKAKKNSTIEIGFKAADGTYFNVGEVSKDNNWQNYKFEFPKDEKLYPIKIDSINVYGEDENNDAKIRNFAKINE